eukprot:1212884-Rhodomonas_salina.1
MSRGGEQRGVTKDTHTRVSQTRMPTCPGAGWTETGLSLCGFFVRLVLTHKVASKCSHSLTCSVPSALPQLECFPYPQTAPQSGLEDLHLQLS